MTKSTGIIMSGDHPVKCRDGTKTVTRRTWGLEKINAHPEIWEFVNMEGAIAYFKHPTGTQIPVKCPYGGVGDRLWMRETWATEKRLDHLNGTELGEAGDVALWYKAGEIRSVSLARGRWRSSRFMPRWASRGKLEIITGFRPERLQAITEEDALAEGITVMQGTWQALGRGEGGKLEPVGEPHPFTARYHFGALWDNLNAKRGYPWDGNHWIWRIPFKLQG